MKRNPGGAPGGQTIGQRPGKGRRRRETEGADKVQKNRGGSTPLSRGESARDVGSQRIAVIFLGAIARHSAQPDRGNGAPEDEGLAGRWERAGGGRERGAYDDLDRDDDYYYERAADRELQENMEALRRIEEQTKRDKETAKRKKEARL